MNGMDNVTIAKIIFFKYHDIVPVTLLVFVVLFLHKLAE
jgi:hypothetical protein